MLTIRPEWRRTRPSPRTRMKPASATRSGECSSIASASAASKASREGNSRSSTTAAGMPACAANSRPAASARLLTTAAIFAGSPARTIASKLLPRPEIRITTDFIGAILARRTFPPPFRRSLLASTLLFFTLRAFRTGVTLRLKDAMSQIREARRRANTGWVELRLTIGIPTELFAPGGWLVVYPQISDQIPGGRGGAFLGRQRHRPGRGDGRQDHHRAIGRVHRVGGRSGEGADRRGEGLLRRRQRQGRSARPQDRARIHG